jgi:hypothetical protein
MVRGVQKHNNHIFAKKSMSKTKMTSFFNISFSSIFLNRAFGFFSAMGVQKHQNSALQKDRVEKFVGVSRRGGSAKTPHKNIK